MSKTFANLTLRPQAAFSPQKSRTMTVKGRLQRVPTIMLERESVTAVTYMKVLGLGVDNSFSFGQHAKDIGEKALNCYGNSPECLRPHGGSNIRAGFHVIRCALLTAQRPALVLMTKAYRSISTDALPVLAGVLPADLEVIKCGKVETHKHESTAREMSALKESCVKCVLPYRTDGLERRKSENCILSFRTSGNALTDYIVPDYIVSQMLTGHRCFRKRLYDMRLNKGEGFRL
ncbi:hypothetical protein EVAR_85152_1 [Eumeta japonica]|uniref:Uncharacterized protein n=1 Tax=Eumeta variegata TaxID=151549 RepID=A0A4C1XTK4_EUMVA|nr:hypothetical protein EVAR_85152_1 [Eumeta japonica]